MINRDKIVEMYLEYITEIVTELAQDAVTDTDVEQMHTSELLGNLKDGLECLDITPFDEFYQDALNDAPPETDTYFYED